MAATPGVSGTSFRDAAGNSPLPLLVTDHSEQRSDQRVEAVCPFTGLVAQYKQWGQRGDKWGEADAPAMLLLHTAGEQFYCWEKVAEVWERWWVAGRYGAGRPLARDTE